MKLIANVLPFLIFLTIYIYPPHECQVYRNRTKGLDELFHKIFTYNNYNQLVRPADPITGLTVVSTELKVIQIDIDEKYQELVSTVWIEMSWEDRRLMWSLDEFPNITEITLPVYKLWTPDIVLQNGVGRNDYLKEMNYFNPWISYTGVITWVPEVRIHTKCIINVADFPFDTQCCEINFYSWAHTMKQMTIKQYGNKNVTNITHLSTNSEWQVYHTCASSKLIETSEELLWWVSSYVICIRRHTTYHIYNLIMPCFILSILSMLLFLLPPDSGEKITLGVTILLAFFVNSLVVCNYTPEATSELPVIGFYYVFNIGLLSMSIGTEVCVLNFYFKEYKKPVPQWVKRFLRIEEPFRATGIKDKLLSTNHVLSVARRNLTQINNDIYQKKAVSNSNLNHFYFNEASQENKYLNNINQTMTKSSSSPNPAFLNANVSGSIGRNCKIRKSLTKNDNLFSIDILKENKNRVDETICSCKAAKNTLHSYANSNHKNSINIVYENKPKNLENQTNTITTNTSSYTKAPSSIKCLPDKEDIESKKENIERVLKLLESSLSKLNKKHSQHIRDEWRKVSSKIDYILFFISASVVTITPLFLFRKFFVRDFESEAHNCGLVK